MVCELSSADKKLLNEYIAALSHKAVLLRTIKELMILLEKNRSDQINFGQIISDFWTFNDVICVGAARKKRTVVLDDLKQQQMVKTQELQMLRFVLPLLDQKISMMYASLKKKGLLEALNQGNSDDR